MIFFTISSFALSPCTSDGNNITSHIGNLLFIVDNISLIAAPVEAVTTPTLFGILGISFLLLELSYRKDKEDKDRTIEDIKEEIRRLKEEM